MDETVPIIPPLDLWELIGTWGTPIVVDVRSTEELAAINRLIPASIHRPIEGVEEWWRDLPSGCGVVVCDLSGGAKAQQVAEALRRCGTDAGLLVDGFIGWHERDLPTRQIIDANSDKWVTREHPKIDRIACPWLISRFINPLAEYVYVPPGEVGAVAEQTGATPYDIKGVRFGHHGDRCSFDAIVRAYDLHDAALDHLATIVRGADTSRPDLTPQGEGLLAISYGLSHNFPNDHAMLKHGMVIYDALYSWCRLQREKQRTPSKATA